MGTNDRGIDLEQRMRTLEGTREVSFDQLFTDAFMKDSTNHASFAAFLEASPFKVHTPDDFRAIPDDDWNEYVRKETSFPSWDEMQRAAATLFAERLVDECLRG